MKRTQFKRDRCNFLPYPKLRGLPALSYFLTEESFAGNLGCNIVSLDNIPYAGHLRCKVVLQAQASNAYPTYNVDWFLIGGKPFSLGLRTKTKNVLASVYKHLTRLTAIHPLPESWELTYLVKIGLEVLKGFKQAKGVVILFGLSTVKRSVGFIDVFEEGSVLERGGRKGLGKVSGVLGVNIGGGVMG